MDIEKLSFRKSKVLFICHTYMHVLKACCKQLNEKQKADIILCDTITDYKGLMKKLSKKHIWNKVYSFDETKCTHKHYYFVRNAKKRMEKEKFKRFVKLFFPVNVLKYKEIYIYNDSMYAGAFLKANSLRYHLVEDGIDFFSIPNPYGKYDTEVSELFESVYYHYKDLKYVIDIEVNNINNAFYAPRMKLIEYPIKNLLLELEMQKRKTIISLFDPKNALRKIEFFLETELRQVALILTQPFGELGCISGDEVGKRYLTLASKYSEKGYAVIIKCHPRDQYPYESDEGILIVSDIFPMELLYYSEAMRRIDVVIACNSSACSMFRNDTQCKMVNISVEDFCGDNWNVDYYIAE